MLPIKLSIEGLYSYQEPQTIDFKRLTDAGLFGIFGGVGAGKSSILEAITFALYGETERLNTNDRRGYNMLNLNANKARILFEFENFKGEIWQFCREWKRKKKRHEDVESTATHVYKRLNDEWIPQENVRAEDVVGGLSYANFKRTIIIPQGKFQEFLQLSGSQRSEMMKEIFHLHKFDLFQKTTRLAGKTKSTLDELNGRLSAFQEFTEEALSEVTDRYRRVHRDWTAAKDAVAAAEKDWKAMEALKARFEERDRCQNEYRILLQESAKNKELEQKLKRYEETTNALGHLLQSEARLKARLQQMEETIRREQEQIQQQQLALKKQEVDFETLKPDFEQIDNWNKQREDAEWAIEILQKKEEVGQTSQRIAKGMETVAANEAELEKEKMILQEVENKLEAKKEERSSAEELLAIANWFSKKEQAEQNKERLDREYAVVQNAIEENDQQLLGLHLDRNHWETEVQRLRDKLQTQKAQLESERQQLFVAQELSVHARHLEDGKPCMLCGSTHHPMIMKAEDMKDRQAALERDLEAVAKEEKKLFERQHSMKERMREAANLSAQREQLHEQLRHQENEMEAIQDTFRWDVEEVGTKERFEQKRNKAKAVEEALHVLEGECKEVRGKIARLLENSKRFEEGLTSLRTKEISLSANLQALYDRLHFLKPDQVGDHAPGKWKEIAIEISGRCERVVSQYTQLEETIRTERNTLETKAALLAREEKLRSQTEKEHSTTASEVDETLRRCNLSDREAAQQILSWEVDLDAEKERLKEFQMRFYRVEENLKKITDELKDKTCDPALFEEKQALLAEKQAGLKILTEEEIQLKAAKAQHEEKRAIRVRLEEEHAALDLRARNLATLSNLFRANGFVNYVSRIFLENLISNANERFRRLTKNQLELCLNEQGNFEVRDYLHDGYCRSIKTLSGGQTFQAALCLALALAGNIQKQSKRNFFFIDEGFGTQDKETNQMVFETLQSLQKENRVVGIISHVEELKEQIPIYLSVTKDPQKGSRITMES